MGTQLERIEEKACREKKLVFTSLYHHVTDIDNLRECYQSLKAYKARGIDGQSKTTYGEQLEDKLQDLSSRLKQMGYRPQPKRRSYIPKPGSPQGRPLGISCFEDKIVEMSMKRVLEPLYEPIFEECSYGYRPKRSPHQCVDMVGKIIQQKRVSHVVEADIKSFFDKVNHDWLITFMRQRVGDTRILRMVQRMLKSGIMEDGLTKVTEEGTPQGSILSPLLSNIYLHYVLDLWFRLQVRKTCRGEAYYFRFADDFIACFQYKSDAEKFRQELERRLEKFGLQIAEDKTRCIEFGRFARDDANGKGKKPEEFTFLGFTFYCGKTRHGKFKVKRKTARKKLILSLRKFTEWIEDEYWRKPKIELIKEAKRMVQGHINYYGITDNSQRCSVYVSQVERKLLKWLNRKSQRKAYAWQGYKDVLKHVRWPKVKIRVNADPFGTIAASF